MWIKSVCFEEKSNGTKLFRPPDGNNVYADCGVYLGSNTCQDGGHRKGLRSESFASSQIPQFYPNVEYDPTDRVYFRFRFDTCGSSSD